MGRERRGGDRYTKLSSAASVWLFSIHVAMFLGRSAAIWPLSHYSRDASENRNYGVETLFEKPEILTRDYTTTTRIKKHIHNEFIELEEMLNI
jgi:hypothetical protein